MGFFIFSKKKNKSKRKSVAVKKNGGSGGALTSSETSGEDHAVKQRQEELEEEEDEVFDYIDKDDEEDEQNNMEGFSVMDHHQRTKTTTILEEANLTNNENIPTNHNHSSSSNNNNNSGSSNKEDERSAITRDLIKKFVADIWNRGEIDLIPQVCSSRLRFNGNNGNMDKVGHEGFARMVATIHDALSEYHCEIHSMVVEGNKAFCRLRFSGRHTGMLLGYEPSHQLISWMGATEFTIGPDNRILKVWELGDMKSLEHQLSQNSQ